jgi:hypothetical protein
MKPTLVMLKCSIRSRGDSERRPSHPNVFWRPFLRIRNWSVSSRRPCTSRIQCHSLHRSACCTSTLRWFTIRTLPSRLSLRKPNIAPSMLVPNQSPCRPTLSYQRLKMEKPLSTAELHDKIRKTVANKNDLQILECLLLFNQYGYHFTRRSRQTVKPHQFLFRHILKTNFYQPTKVAVSFRLDGNFLPDIEYPTKPLAVFIVVGSEFRGFHIRFRDVARGGIRIVQSKGAE